MSPLKLYEATRGFWAIDSRRERVELALAVYQGIAREVYRLRAWHPAGRVTDETRDAAPYRGGGRWESGGDIAEDMRDDYTDRSVGKDGQNPIRCVNIQADHSRRGPFACAPTILTDSWRVSAPALLPHQIILQAG
jgi:uncharacterized protein